MQKNRAAKEAKAEQEEEKEPDVPPIQLSREYVWNGTMWTVARRVMQMQKLPVDAKLEPPRGWKPPRRVTTIATACEVTGRGTYDKRATRTLRFLPAEEPGWRIQRTDLKNAPAIVPSLLSVADTHRALLLQNGPAENTFQMAEHVICQRMGLALDALRVETDSSDPPLFQEGSWDIVEALQKAGTKELDIPLRYLTVKEPVFLADRKSDGFLFWVPSKPGSRRFILDVSVDFPNAIGQQRIQAEFCPEVFCHGARARTNCTAGEMHYARTLGRLLPRYRNLGYDETNILVAGKKEYVNQPAYVQKNGKSLEAVWHRTCLDLMGALALMPPAIRPAGWILSYKAGHSLDVEFLRRITEANLWEEVC